MTDSKSLDLIRAALAEVAPKRKSDWAKLDATVRINALALDSVTVLEMVGALEDRLDVVFAEDELALVKNVGDLVGVVSRAQRAA